MNKPLIETIKTIVIAVLLSAIVAFIGGVKYQNGVQHQIDAKTSPSALNAPVPASK